MLGKVILYALGLPIALICCILAPVIYISVIAVSPLGLFYRYIVKPLLTGSDKETSAAALLHRPTA